MATTPRMLHLVMIVIILVLCKWCIEPHSKSTTLENDPIREVNSLNSNLSDDRNVWNKLAINTNTSSYEWWKSNQTFISKHYLKNLPLEKCKSTYFIQSHAWYMTKWFWHSGFRPICTSKEKNKLFIGNKNYQFLKYFPISCNKYIGNTPAFCNGGRLVYEFSKQEEIFIARSTTKTRLNMLLKTYCDKYHSEDNDCNFYLRSYNMDNNAERFEFLMKHIDCNNDASQYNKTWVFKEDKHFGTGVHFENCHQLIYRLLISSQNETLSNCSFNPITNDSYFIQKGFNYHQISIQKGGNNNNTYTTPAFVINTNNLLMQPFVSNPMLLILNDGIKHAFHLRSYFLRLSYDNISMVFHWPKYVILVNPNEYPHNATLNKASMITNRHISKNEEIIDDKLEWTWGESEFQQYIDRIYGKHIFDGNYATNKLKNDIRHMIKIIFSAHAYANEIGLMGNVDDNKQYKKMVDDNKFELNVAEYCLDIMINDQFETKLAEINANCGSPCNKTQIIEKQKHGIYDWDCNGRKQQTMAIVSEIFGKKSTNQTIERIACLKDFELIYWDK